MEIIEIKSTDITIELRHYIDKYLKTVIINVKKRFYRKASYLKKYGIVFVELDKYSDNIRYDEPGFNKVSCQFIKVDNYRIPVYNEDLAEALISLTDIQRLILIKNVVLEIPLSSLSKELKISKRMIEKHKHNAIQFIKRRMSYYA